MRNKQTLVDGSRITCCKCDGIIRITPEITMWDESGYGYSTKLVKCPECGQINIIGYVEDDGFDVNYDLRFYEYRRR